MGPARLLLLISVAALGAVDAHAAAGADGRYLLKYWETDDGLPHNVVNSLALRSDGFIWIATSGGAVRFDGVEFSPPPSPPAGFGKSSLARCLIEENPRSLLIANNAPELWRFEGGALTLHPLTGHFRPAQKIAWLFREADDVFWIAFDDREVWRWNRGSIERYTPPAPRAISETRFAQDSGGRVFVTRGAGVETYRDRQLVPLLGLPAGPVALGSSRSGGIWLVASGRICRLEGERVRTVSERLPWPASSRAAVAYETRDGALWVALADGGIWRWTPEGCEPVELSYPRVRDMLEDDSGNLWLATAGGGLDRLRPTRFVVLSQESGLTPGNSGSICEDSRGRLVYADRNAVYSIPSDGASPVDESAKWPKKALPLCPDKAGNLWIAAGAQLSRADQGGAGAPVPVGGSNPEAIRALFGARDGSLWVGREAGPLERIREGLCDSFGPEAGYPAASFTLAIGQDASGHLWIGNREGELFEMQAGRFVRYAEGEGLPGRSIRAIHGDSQGALWIGTGGGGLVLRKNGRFYRLGRAQGLPDDTLSQILEDDFGFLWIGSSRWLFRVAKTDLIDCAEGRTAAVTPVIYGRSDGLSGFTAVDGFQPGAWKTSQGRLWFATRKGLVMVDPARHQSHPSPPRVSVDRFTVGGRSVDGDTARVASSDHGYEFRFTAPSYESPEDLRFRYRLAGVETEWSEPTNQRSVRYPVLAPGRYEFLVTARSGSEDWNPRPASISFNVGPVWWETWWARVGEVGLAAASLGSMVRYESQRRLKARLRRLELSERVEAERARIARDLHDGLGAGLTQVSMMAEEMCEDTDTLAVMKAQSVRLMERVRRITCDLEGVVWTASPQYDNLPALCAYLGQFSSEYLSGTGMRCRVDASSEIPSVPVLPDVRHHLFMIAKESVNNALKHSGASQLDLAFRMRDGIFELIVADNGRGFDPAAAAAVKRRGLRNMRERAAELGGEMEIRSSGSGTAVRVRVPIRDEPARSAIR